MKKTVGLWIDHKRAVIVSVTGTEEEIKLIHSNIGEQRIEQQRRQNGRSVPSDDIRLRVSTEHLNTTTRKSFRAFVMQNPFYYLVPAKRKAN